MAKIDSTKRFKFYDKKKKHLGDGVVETVLTDDFDPSFVDAYIVRFDNGDIKWLNASECTMTEIE